jgi:hypothetical protein
MTRALLVSFIALVATSQTARSDWTEARCDIYPKGEDRISAMLPCTFGQRQGTVSITRSDGVAHELTPVGEQPGNYVDQDGKAAYRRGGLGKSGLIFRLDQESVFVFWDTSTLYPETDPGNPTAPSTMAEYDATTLLRCGRVDDPEMGLCPAGILRMEGGQASTVITGPGGEEFTINFMRDGVNATAGQVDAGLDQDTWTVIVNGVERYEVPLAAIEGG